MIKVGNANVSDQNGEEDDTTHIVTRHQTSQALHARNTTVSVVSLHILFTIIVLPYMYTCVYVCYFTGLFYAVVRQISMLLIDNKDSYFCKKKSLSYL